MTKEKSIKQKLISAVLVLAMTFSMLVGTTFAWFTDSVSSAGNKIQVGTLKVDLSHKDGDNWISLKENEDHLVFDYDKWEPGFTLVESLKVENLGNLAFKYKLSLTVEDGTANSGAYGVMLADVIDVYVSVGNYTESSYAEIQSSWTYKGTLNEVMKNPSSFVGGELLPDGKTLPTDAAATTAVKESVVNIALHMREEAGNEYQKLTVGNIFIDLVATQWSYESDSFGNDYDELAPFPTLGTGSASAIVKVENNATKNEVKIQGEGFSAFVPAGTGVNNNKVDSLVLTIEELPAEDSEANLILKENEALRPMGIHIEGVSENNAKPIIIELEGALAAGYNNGNYKLVHVEDGSTNEMTIVNSLAELDEHNECYYDPASGKVYLAMASFSEVSLVATTDNVWNGTIAEGFAGGSGTDADPYLIANADQLAYLGEVISNFSDEYANKSYKLLADVDLGGEANANKGIIFYPIGYHKIGGGAVAADVDSLPEALAFSDNYDDSDYSKNREEVPAVLNDNSVWYTYGGAFEGTFDGNGNKISNIYQNTWQLKGNYSGNYWNAAMGIFGYVYGATVKNLSVDNFSSDGEYTPTGVIAAYAVNSSFENIAITNCNPRVYNTGNGGIVGIGGNSSDTDESKLSFTNITIDNTNKISALWGSWDVACGGLVGMFRGAGHVYMKNCHVGAQIDVFNDVCGNYQYYWYRYSGMLIGTNNNMTTDENGYTVPETDKFHAENCTVHFGTWNDYYYCELVANTIASYTHDYQFSRLTKIDSLDEIKNGDVWTKSGNFLYGGECYHIVNKGGVFTRHFHEDSGEETVNGTTVLKENNKVVYLPFNQLFTGYGWGVKHVPVKNGEAYAFEGVTILDRQEANSINKFESKLNGEVFESETILTLGEIFKALEGVSINLTTLKIFVSPVGEESTASAIYAQNADDWTKSTLTLKGVGALKITITDYTYCKEAVAIITVEKHEHSYDNDCDTSCNTCGEERSVEHKAGNVVKENVLGATCTEAGSYDNVVYCTACNKELSRETVTVDATGHNYNTSVTAPNCTEKGFTTYTCSCGHSYTADEVAALGHNYNSVVTAPNCTEAGFTTYTCKNCEHSYVADEVAAKGHSYNETVTDPTCEEDGYTTYTCHCGYSYVDDVIAATGHNYNAVVTDPTCTAGGFTTYTCEYCFDTYTGNQLEASGHSYNAVVTDPTCTEKGFTTYTCKNCSYSYTADEVAALGHSYNKAVTAPTCTAEGYTTYTCACGDTYVADKVAAKEHNYNNSTVTAPTCTEKGYTTYTCACGDNYTANEVAALGQIESKFTGNFLYRVGNQNAVDLSSLFNVGKHSVTVSGSKVSGNASVTINGTSLDFNGTGVVRITLTSDCTCGNCDRELTLEVVDAVNATGATNATSSNVVLLNDAGFSSLEVSGGYTLYGNGFTLTCSSDSYALDMGYAFVNLDNGTLDNVQIVCPNFDYAVLYKSNMTESGNRKYTDDKGTTRYYNVKSGVMVTGNSQILNSRISGARAAVNVAGGNVLIDNSRIELGAVASILVGSANSLTLRDVTLIQEPTASTYDSSKVLMGFSVLTVCDSEGNSTPITIEGALVQYAWVNETDKQYVPSAGESIINTVLGKTEYLHDLDGDGKNESLNLGFAYMPESLTSKVNATTIIDNRTNKGSIPYAYAEVSILSGKTYVYSYKNSNGTDNSFKEVANYAPNKYSDIVTVNYSDSANGLESSKSFGTNGWVYELNVDLDKASGYKLDFSKLSMMLNGVAVTDYKVNGSAKPTSPVAVTAGGVTYTLTATVDGKEYTATYKVTGTETSKESPKLTTSNYQSGLCVASSYGGTWHGAAPALEGLVITYWSVAEGKYIDLDLGAIEIGKGQLNGTNTTWTYTPANGDYTITLTGGQVHSSNNVYAMPVGVNGTLYFVASASKGLVNSGNSARAVPVSYTFKDNNGGDVLSFSHTWSVSENKDAEYKYSDFCKGTLTKLEKSCVTSDTLITLADGTKKRIDEVTYDDQLLVWNFYTGNYDVVPAAIIFYHGDEEYDVVKLYFEDGTIVKVINNHGFYDIELDEFIFLDANNADEYIGHKFVKVDGEGRTAVALVGYEVVKEYTGCYSIQSAIHINFMVEDMFSLTIPPFDGWFDYFEIGDGMKYDEEKMQADIEKYGLYTYEEFSDLVSYEQFIAFNGPYLKVLVGRGVVTLDEILELIATYVNPVE